jgi:hypothetical protein
VEASALFAAQLPDLIRGVFYAGWSPNTVPEEHGVEAYRLRAARAATTHDEVGEAGRRDHGSRFAASTACPVNKALDQLPTGIRTLMLPPFSAAD